MHEMLKHKEAETSTFAAELYCLTNEKHQNCSNTDEQQGTDGVDLLTIAAGSPFKAVNWTRAMVTASLLDSQVVVVVHIVLSLTLCGSAHHSR